MEMQKEIQKVKVPMISRERLMAIQMAQMKERLTEFRKVEMRALMILKERPMALQTAVMR